MNEEALRKTKETGWVYFWSRSRKRLWMKGEESGNKLKLSDVTSVTPAIKRVFLEKYETRRTL